MKESILDVLLYLFEHYIYDQPELVQDPDSLQNSLLQAGFSASEVSRAFIWLETLAQDRPASATPVTSGPIRLFASFELEKFELEARGFLMFLEQNGVVSAEQRELVIDRAMALELDEIALDDLKWVVLMVLFNQPGSEAAFAWMESQIFSDDPEPIH
jgi:Smg protein